MMPLPKRPALLAAAALLVSALLGLALAAWLSWRAPLSPLDAQEPEVPSRVVAPVGDLPEPPQPLLDGGRGVPERAATAAIPTPMVSVLGSEANPTVVPPNAAPSDLPASPVTAGKASTVVTVRSEQQAAASNATAPKAATPAQSSPPAPSPAPVTPTTPAQPAKPSAAWLEALRSDLAACQSQGLLTRVVCQERARWRHCDPARAWGTVPECPGTRPSP